MHGLYMVRRNQALATLHAREDTYVHIDGMPLIGLCRFAGVAATRAHRVTWLDLLWPLLSMAEHENWRVYYLGGSDHDQLRGLSAIRSKLPGLKLRGHHGHFDMNPGELAATAVREDIQAFAPHLLLVGMGMDRQERWILQNEVGLEANCIFTTGACLEYIAGSAGSPPRWMGRWGVEWLYRLTANPKRFWVRYLVEPWIVICDCLRFSLWGT